MKSNKQLLGIIEILKGALIDSKDLAELVIKDEDSTIIVRAKAEHVLSIINESQSATTLES